MSLFATVAGAAFQAATQHGAALQGSMVEHGSTAPLSDTATGPQIASGDGSSGGGLPAVLVLALVIGFLVLATYLRGSEPTVVVVQRPVSSFVSFFGFIVISLAVVIIVARVTSGAG